jgi:hypothetical protein
MNTHANLSGEEITKSLQLFKRRRDDLLHEDADTFDHHHERFVQFCRTDPLARRVPAPLEERLTVDVDGRLEAVYQHDAKVAFPDEPDEELLLRYRVLERAAADDHLAFRFGIAQGQRKQEGWINHFRTIVVRPFALDLSHQLGDAAELATPETPRRSRGLFGFAFQADKKEEPTPEEYARQEAERVKSKYIAAALAGIAEHGEAHDVQFGRHYLRRDDYDVLVEAVEVIKKFGDDDDVHALVELAKAKEGVLQESAGREGRFRPDLRDALDLLERG